MSANELIDPGHQSRDLRMIRAAVKKGWNIPDEVLEELPGLVWNIAKDSGEAAKDRISAAKLLDTMKGRNDKMERPKRPKRPPPVPTTAFVLMDGQNLDDAKRALLDRLTAVRDHSGGAGGDRAADPGTGDTAG